jgi:glucosamine--fructose-6-phosphate aminotransferase (isomerizing)
LVKGHISLAEARAAQAANLTAAAAPIAEEVMAADRAGALQEAAPIFVGMGASFAACASAVWTLRERGVGAIRISAGESPLPFPEFAAPLIGVSQSGRSTETLALFKTIERERRIAVVNAKDSPMAAISSTSISLGGMPDSYASTIGFTATLMALGMLAEVWASGVIDAGWSTAGAAVSETEARLAGRISELIAPLVEAEYVDCAASAPLLGSAEVGALLLREVARLPATGMSTRQYLHGAMESAGHGVHILFGDAREIELGQTLARAGHDTIIVSPLEVSEERHLRHIALRLAAPVHRAIVEAVLMQTLAVEAALARGLDPDAFVFEHSDTKAP